VNQTAHLPRTLILRIVGFSFATTLSANIMNPGLFGHKVVEMTPPGWHNSVLGLMTFVWSSITIVNLPLVGKLSDRTATRLGRRLPFFILGAIGMSLAVLGVAVAPTLPVLLIAIVLLSLFDDTIIAPWLAYFRETVPESQRGEAAGHKSLVDIVGVVAGRLLAGLILGSPWAGEYRGPLLLSTIIVAWLLVSLIILPPQPASPVPASSGTPKPIWRDLKSVYRVDWQAHPWFVWWFANRLFFWMAFIILGTFTLFFATDVLGYSAAQAQRFVATLSAIIGGMILFVAVPAGRLADRLDNRIIMFASCLSAAAGALLLLMGQAPALLWASALLIGLGAGFYMSANLALLTKLVPAHEAGHYLGMSGVASAIGGALARLLGGLTVDPINFAANSTRLGHVTLFALAAGAFLAAAFAALRIRALPRPAYPPPIVEKVEDIG
jgi:MFS family permease